MGYKDYTKTWWFEVEATPAQCEQAFAQVFERGKAKSGLGMSHRAKFSVHRVTDQEAGEHLVAVFEGHAGFDRLIQGTVGSMSQTVGAMNANAKGSQVAFRARPGDEPGTTQCQLWLKNWVQGLSTEFKRFMKEVERELRRLDPSMRSAKVKG